jgi:hypothetical protein
MVYWTQSLLPQLFGISLAFAKMPRAEARGGMATGDRAVARRAKAGLTFGELRSSRFGAVPLGFTTDAPCGSAGSFTVYHRDSVRDDFKPGTKLKEGITDEEKRSCTQRGTGECGIGAVRDVARRCLQQIGARKDLVMSGYVP